MKPLQSSFAGGEIAPDLHGRADLPKYRTALAECRNFIALAHGPAANRPGFQFVHEVKDSSKSVRLIPFQFSTTQTYVIEVGDGYLRFHTNGGTVLAGSPGAYNPATAYVIGDMCSSGGVNYYCIAATTGNAPPNAAYWYALPATGEYEIPTPYAEADLFRLKYVQSADVLTICHASYAPRELRRYGATNWQLALISFAPSISAPTSVTATPTGAGATTYSYKVTALTEGMEESDASSSANCTNDLTTSPNLNTVSWTGSSGAVRYQVYKQQNGLYGYIGQTDGTSFVDQNITPDMTITPPQNRTPFSGAGNYPATVSYFEQRRVFGATANYTQTIWTTRSGTESNMSISIPSQDDDAITFTLAARQVNEIRHIVPLSDMVVLTSGAEWRVAPQGADILTPSSVAFRAQGYVGAAHVQPIVSGSVVLFVQSRGSRVFDLSYALSDNAYKSSEVSILATHLFDGYTLVDWAYAQVPHSIVWAVRSDGTLLGLTYVPGHEVYAWHQHTTENGAFESVTVVAEGLEDVPYVVVNRTLGATTKRYIERLHTRYFTSVEEAFFVDCGLTYDGAAATTISGLDHLEGESVVALADGSVVTGLTVSGGAITLPVAASLVHVGLQITADLKTLPALLQTLDALGQGRRKSVTEVALRVGDSRGGWVGPSFDTMEEWKQRTDEAWGAPTRLYTGLAYFGIPPDWSDDGQVCVRQTDPLPLKVQAIVAEVALGG